MKAITICQPWAWAIIHGPKRIENRTWATHYRGPLAIHAGKGQQWMEEGCQFLRELGIELPREFVFGAVLGTVELVGIDDYPESPGLLDDARELLADPFASGPKCWRLANPQPLEAALPIKGKQNLWPINLDVERHIASTR